MSRRTVKNSVETDVYITRPTRLFNACTNLALSRTSHKLRPHATHNACGAEHTISQSALTARRPTGIPLLTHTFPVLSATVTTSNGMTSDCQRFIRTDRVSHLYPLRVRHAGKNPRIAISRRHLVWSPHERVKQVFR